MKMIRFVDRAAFYVTVAAGTVGAIAGAYNWSRAAIAAGCIAGLAPIVNRITAAREQKMKGPRSISPKQRERLIKRLRNSPLFKVWVCHNREESEPSQFHEQISDALKEAGLDVHWFGGMNNKTVGIEIAGSVSPEKTLLMAAFTAAGIPFLEVEFTDDQGKFWGLSVWIGSNPR
jgi:hypothetical protein